MAKILVVDDSPTMLSGTSKILESAGHEVVHATNGQEGIEKSVSETPDLILMDVVMPDINGFQATRKITTTENTQHIPVIILTMLSMDDDIKKGIRLGASDYIVKSQHAVSEIVTKTSTSCSVWGCSTAMFLTFI